MRALASPEPSRQSTLRRGCRFSLMHGCQVVLSAIILSIAGSVGNVRSNCDQQLIWRELRRVEIADYIPTATTPPPLVSAELYASLATKTAACARGPVHFMDTSIGDLLQAAAFAKFSAGFFFEGGNIPEGCTMVRESLLYANMARSQPPKAGSTDALDIRASKNLIASLKALLASRCR